MYTQLLIPSKAKCASGNVTYLGSCMTELLKTVERKVKVQQLNSNHCFCYPSISALHSMDQTNTRTHNIIAQSKRHKYSIFKCSYSIKVTTTKEYFSQCMLQQQSLSNTKRLLKEHSQTIIIITGSLEMNENEKKGRDQIFMQYGEITVQTGKGIRLV